MEHYAESIKSRLLPAAKWATKWCPNTLFPVTLDHPTKISENKLVPSVLIQNHSKFLTKYITSVFNLLLISK
jgi:hypothetical protein